MSRLTALAALQITAAVGTAGWWAYWFASGAYHERPHCTLVYENSFPVADLVLAACVLMAALQVLRRHPSALLLGFVGAGMALDLAVLDTAHNLITSAFDTSFPTVLRKVVFAVVNALVGVLTLVTLSRHRADFPGAPDGSVSRHAAGTAAIAAMLGGVGIVAYALGAPVRPECARDVEGPFAGPLALIALLGGLAARGLSGHRTRPLVLATGGALIHAGLVATLYTWTNPDLFESRAVVLLPILAVVWGARLVEQAR